VQIHILDEQQHELPQGVEGEIYIGGSGVARGYLNAPKLTAAKIISTKCLDNGPNSLLYRTGDIGRLLPDGQIAFLGRIDDQIKIRGHRVEPSEVVTALNRHPDVEESVVVAREDARGERRLVAYVVLSPETRSTTTGLREFLAHQLPEYMVPAIFVRMDSLPLNANGKADRTALPTPDNSNSLDKEVVAEPRTPVQKRVTEILIPLLGVGKVGVDENFFMLGGHSLLGSQLIARIRQAFHVDVTLRSLFESPSIAALAAEIERLLYLRLEAMTEQEVDSALNGPEK
jgi:hypothetical protein